MFLTRKAGWLGGEAREVVAVDDIGFSVNRGETLAIVGESGSGKTTVSKMIMRAVQPDQGRVVFHGADGPVDVLALDEAALQGFRRHIQYIFQDPFGSLDPRMTVADIVAEPLLIHDIGSDAERTERVKRLLQAVGLDVRHMRRYPHSFSGGQRQRIGIARALALEPEILICDEPVSALDVSVQAQILNLLKDLQKALGLTYLFISHNLAVVKYVAQRIAVMCAGRMVELAPTDRLFANPAAPLHQGAAGCRAGAGSRQPARFRGPRDRAQFRAIAMAGPLHAADRFGPLSRGRAGAFRPVPELIRREQGASA